MKQDRPAYGKYCILKRDELSQLLVMAGEEGYDREDGEKEKYRGAGQPPEHQGTAEP